MERKEVFILIAACLAVCLIIGCMNMFRDSTAEDTPSTPTNSESQSTEATVSTNYWDYLHSQNGTEPVQTDENGNPIPTETDETSDPIPAETDENGDPIPAETNGNDEPSVTGGTAPAGTDEQPNGTDIFSSVSTGEATTAVTTVTTGTTVSTTPFVLHITG